MLAMQLRQSLKVVLLGYVVCLTAEVALLVWWLAAKPEYLIYTLVIPPILTLFVAIRHIQRRVTKITEITGMEGDTVLTQDLFEYVRSGIDPHGRVMGHFQTTGTRPFYAERFEAAGFSLPQAMFAARVLG